jgi:predicted nucleotidyltransferase
MTAPTTSSIRLDMVAPAQAVVARRFVEDEMAKREFLVVFMSGGHSYGFASPDSDLDLKAVHIAATRDLIGFSPATPTVNWLGFIDDVEIDYTSNELQLVLGGVLGGNGNFLERILGATVVFEGAALPPLRPLVRAVLSRRVHRHYAGFARSQRKAVDAAATPTAKKILYVLRTTLTGTHLLTTGELVTDVKLLLDDHGFAAARELIAIKQAGERTELTPDDAARWRVDLDRAQQLLDDALAASPLPEEPPPAAVAELEDWLVEVPRQRL